APGRTGRGLFAAVLMEHWPLLPVEEEGRLNDPRLRENFIERVFGYKRWSDFSAGRRSARALETFHRRHKFLLLAHSDSHLRSLGRLVAGAKRDIAETYRDYGKVFMEGLSVLSTRKKQTNVLEHLQGFVSDHLDKNERGELTGLIKDYHRGLYPLIVPLTLIRHFVRKYDVAYLEDQYYLEPNPRELMLRNHV
ncbi:MAG TPA: DUF1722 domain-containing protein, partial [Nitrospiria bacterium]|nr:DUF1722 domain-containing protein [Nitrospiria bacterium]